ncbi:hypothetical protein Tco_1290447, partial [Tanacetum coccineum]
MSDLKFADTYNLVAFLEKPTESEGFEEIVDFLNANPIKYALTFNLTIYLDKKKVIITESTIRRDLQLEDANGVDCLPNAVIFEQLTLMGDMSHHKRIYVTPSHTKKIFGNMKREGKGFSGRVTPLFQTMMVQAQEKIADEATNEENVPTQSNDPPLSRVNTLGSEEDRLKLKELMDLYTKLSNRVLDLEIIKTAQAKEIACLKKREDASKQGRKIADIDADVEEVEVEMVVNTAEVTTVSATTTIVDELTLARTLIEIKAAKPKAVTTAAITTLIDVTKPRARGAKDKGKAKMVELEKPLKKKDQIMYDKEVAQKLQAQLDAELEEEEKLARQREEDANIAEWDNVQAMMDVDYELAARLQAEEQGELTIEEKSRLAGEELESKNLKKQKLDENVEAEVDDNQEEAKMKTRMEIVPDNEVAIDAIPLATKPLIIVDWKIIKEGKMGYFQIIRADGSSKRYSSMIRMLQNINREDLENLWKLVKAKHGLTRPWEAYERVLWGNLEVMFEPDVESEVWRNLQGHKVTVWKLF